MGKTNAWSEDHGNGAFKSYFPSIPFFGRDPTTETDSLGNLYALRLLEVMHSLGYEFILSSDLSSIHGQGSLFFRLADEVSIWYCVDVIGSMSNLQSSNIIVHIQPWLGNNGSNFGRNFNHQTSYIYKSAGRQAGRHKQGQVAELVFFYRRSEAQLQIKTILIAKQKKILCLSLIKHKKYKKNFNCLNCRARFFILYFFMKQGMLHTQCKMIC